MNIKKKIQNDSIRLTLRIGAVLECPGLHSHCADWMSYGYGVGYHDMWKPHSVVTAGNHVAAVASYSWESEQRGESSQPKRKQSSLSSSSVDGINIRVNAVDKLEL